ncbi:MAG: choice-of-anchor D domain-containing protein [Burkholderiales bacterium]|nr:choice-of-anchor D domain-containing protein [Burkholderiales bacterium]
MTTTPSTSVATVNARALRARTIAACLAAAGFGGGLALPVPMALAAEPAAEVYARETPLVVAQAGGSGDLLYEPGSIAAMSPMAQNKSTGGLEVRIRPLRQAAGTSRLAGALAAPKVVSAFSYYCYTDYLVDMTKGIAMPPAAIAGEPSSRTVTITNTTANPKRFDGTVTTSGPFGALSNCAGSLAPGDSCTIELTFAPQTSGVQTGELTIPGAGVEAALTVPVTAVTALYGTTPYIYPDCLQFPPTIVGDRSYSESVEVYNAYYPAYTYEDMVVNRMLVSPSSFAIESHTCSAPVPVDYSCYIDVFFRPAVVGPIEGTLTVGANTVPWWSLYPVTLLGTGLAAPAGTLDRSPDGLVFGIQDVGTTSAAQQIVVRNQATVPVQAASASQDIGSITEIPLGFPVHISAVTASGDFAQTNDCGTLSSGESCRITVTFTPTAEGERRGRVTVESDATNPVLHTQLVGTGALPALPAIQLSAYAASFANGVMGRPGETKTITVKSVGRADLLLKTLYVAGDYSQSNNCPGTLVPGAECRVNITFNPTISGPRPGTLTVESNATPPFTQATLIGKGCRIYTPSGSRLPTLVCN